MMLARSIYIQFELVEKAIVIDWIGCVRHDPYYEYIDTLNIGQIGPTIRYTLVGIRRSDHQDTNQSVTTI